MHWIFEYGAWVGSAWLTSNVLFIIVWCWLHSESRPWMSDEERKLGIFAIPAFEPDQDDTDISFFPEHLLGTLDPASMTFDTAS
jgi:hypothetical protein